MLEEKRLKKIEETLLELRPLIPTLKRIVEAEEAKTWLSAKIASTIKMIAIVVGIMSAIFGILWAVVREVRK